MVVIGAVGRFELRFDCTYVHIILEGSFFDTYCQKCKDLHQWQYDFLKTGVATPPLMVDEFSSIPRTLEEDDELHSNFQMHFLRKVAKATLT